MIVAAAKLTAAGMDAAANNHRPVSSTGGSLTEVDLLRRPLTMTMIATPVARENMLATANAPKGIQAGGASSQSMTPTAASAVASWTADTVTALQ